MMRRCRFLLESVSLKKKKTFVSMLVDICFSVCFLPMHKQIGANADLMDDP